MTPRPAQPSPPGPPPRAGVAAGGLSTGPAGGLSPGSAAAQSPRLTIDALGKKCPIPIIMLAERISEVPVRGLIEVLADDPAATTDLPAWCVIKSHSFVAMTELPVGWSFLVRRSY